MPPQGFGGGYGPAPQGPWGPQQWSGGPGGQPPKGGRGKWILGGIAVVLAIALAVVITVLVVRPADGGGGNGDPTQQNGDSEFASADDTGPVNIIMQDPTCEAWGRIARTYADRVKAAGWGSRDQSLAGSQWTTEQRSMYDTVGQAMLAAAETAESLIMHTPHRVMRELYGQFVAYARAFVDRIPSYKPQDDALAVVTDTITTATADICSAIDYGSAEEVAPLVLPPAEPTSLSDANDLGEPAIFLPSTNPVCVQWEELGAKFAADSSAWRGIDANIPSTAWSPEQRATNDAVAPIMTANANEIEGLGRQSGNPILEDLAVLAAQYRRAYVAALPTYSPADNFLSESASRLVTTVSTACKAATS
ncbi:hypothetical protein [[Mycobacterium] manitobense]|nr:hypothetical protein [[Mycobacterium] manitobense]